MMRRYIYCLMIMSANAWALPEGRVNLSIDPGNTYWVGQRVLVHLDLKTNGFSFSGQRFNFPQISGGALLQTDTSTLKLTELIDGESWQVLRYDLSLFSQRSGEVKIPPFDVHFTASQGYGQPETSFDLQTPALSVALQLPPGADPSQPIVTTPRLIVKEQWQPDQSEFKVGEALTRTITLEAEDVSGVALPAGPKQVIEGIDQLPRAPLIEDKSDRGTLSGHRREQVSYLFNRIGEYTLSSGSISWWNPQTNKLERHQYDAKSVTVKPDPLARTNDNELVPHLDENRLLQFVFMFFAVLVVAGAFLYWRWPRIQAGRAARYHSEHAQFKRAIRACRKSDAKAAWFTSNAWFAATGLAIPPQDIALWQELQRAMVSKSGKWSGLALKKTLSIMRKNAQSKAKNVAYLKPLNP